MSVIHMVPPKSCIKYPFILYYKKLNDQENKILFSKISLRTINIRKAHAMDGPHIRALKQRETAAPADFPRACQDEYPGVCL